MYRETLLKGPGQWTRLNIRCKLPNLFVFALKSFLMCLGFYHLITIGSIVTNSWMFHYRRSPIISSGPRSDLGHWTSSEDNVIRTQVQRDSNNVTNVQEEDGFRFAESLMTKCPSGWALEILEFSKEGKPLSQVCRKKSGGNWKCADGWEKLDNHPFCKRRFERPMSVIVSNKLRLIFAHIPHSGSHDIEKYLASTDETKADKTNITEDENFLGLKQMSFSTLQTFINYHKATMVHHPCSRLYSVWIALSQMKTEAAKKWAEKHLDEQSLNSFETFVEKVLQPEGSRSDKNDFHLQSQVDLLFGLRDEVKLDEILYFERWEESMNVLRNITTSDAFTEFQPLMNIDFDCQKVYTLSTWSKMKSFYEMDFCVFGYNIEIDKSRESPSMSLTSETANSRFKTCQQQTQVGHVAEERKSQVEPIIFNKDANSTTGAGCTMYTYFQRLENTKDVDVLLQNITLNTWRAAWKAAGWKTRILTEADALSHPEYELLRKKFETFPSVNEGDYEISCFMRYIAMANIGGGWMTDFDVIPIRFPACTEELYHGSFTIYQKHIPGMVSASPSEYMRIVRLMADIQWQGDDHFTFNGRPHVSDMHCILKFINQGLVNTVNVIVPADIFFTKENFCHASNYDPFTGQITPQLSTLAWAVHFSHHSGLMLKDNINTLPEDLATKLQLKNRANLMRSAYRVFRETCHYYD
ncbi:uncharacterized protein [Apostichopus japonicus]|uniref:uncharacterized protein n=1 Tax=Stichopus japonicus TaxID=307972 RepID=UPI003AB34F02